MGIKFNPLVIEGLDVAGAGGSTPTVGSTVIPGSVGDSVLITDDQARLQEIVLEDGELLIGSTGGAPQAATLSGTTNQVSVLNAPNSITLSLPQDIATTSSPQFAAVQTGVLDRATPGTITIGAVNGDTINIGNPGSQVNLQGDVNILNSTILEVDNPLILVNKGGPVDSAGGAGLEVEEDNVVTGYDKVAADRLSWELKAPGRAGTLNLQPPTTGNLTINQELFDSKYDASNPLGFETPAQLDARDTANRDRTNHTGTQLSNTISDFNTAVDARVDLHADLTNNPHNVTATQVGLGNVDNTSDLDKPISTATQAALDLKANIADLGDLAYLDQVTNNEIVDNVVLNSKLADMNAETIKGRLVTAGDPQDLTVPQVRTLLQVETTAQLDARDTANRDRANHTGSQLASTISDFTEASQDAVALAFANGTQDGVTVTYDDLNDLFDVTNVDKGSVAVATHEAALDPHSQYLTETEADGLYDVLGAAATVQTNLDNHINDTTDAHDASVISVVPSGNLASTNVQDALEELQTDIDGLTSGDLTKVAIALAENQIGATVTGVLLNPADINARLTASVSIEADTDLYELFIIDAVYNGGGWFVSVEKVGDNTGVVFDIDNSGQLIYDSSAYTGFVAGNIYVRGTVH